jgi:WD40 repeat protein
VYTAYCTIPATHDKLCVQVVYSPDGRRLFTAGSDGVICVHDATRSDYAPIKMLATDAGTTAGSVISIGVSPDSLLLAVVGIEVRVCACITAATVSSHLLRAHVHLLSRTVAHESPTLL